jgi:hypothetical protein
MESNIKDLDKEKLKEDEANKMQAKAIKKSSFANVPTAFKILGMLVLFLKFNEISKTGGNIGQMWIWIIVVGMVWYFLGMDFKMGVEPVLTPKEAYDAIRKEVALMKKDDRIKYNKKVIITPVQNLQHHEALPVHYIFSVEIISTEGIHRKYKFMVPAKGETRGYVFVVETPLRVRGEEAEHTRSIVPKWVKDSEKYPALKGLFGLGNK